MSTSALPWAAPYVIMWNIRKYRNAAWETEVGMRWNLKQVCQVRWAYQIIPSNRFWITRCDWVTTINKVTWVQANWNGKHKQTHTHNGHPHTDTHTHTKTQSERWKCCLFTKTMMIYSIMQHLSKQTQSQHDVLGVDKQFSFSKDYDY